MEGAQTQALTASALDLDAVFSEEGFKSDHHRDSVLTFHR